jgi:hypothetical protein
MEVYVQTREMYVLMIYALEEYAHIQSILQFVMMEIHVHIMIYALEVCAQAPHIHVMMGRDAQLIYATETEHVQTQSTHGGVLSVVYVILTG